jgi:two-component system, chemotaxis family, chemotaxis protein CheY
MSLNVLIVDDSAVMRQVILKTLRLSGLSLGEVHQAGNGAEGLAVIAEQWVDLVLVDINMPVMNGQEMIERLRGNSETAKLPVIVVSTDASNARVEMMQKHGAEYVHKPFTAEELRDKIFNVTGASHDELVDQRAVQGDGPDF